MTKQMRGRSLAIACCCALVGVMGIANTAHATVFLNETFTYPDGNLVPNGNWTAHSQAGNGPIQVVGGQIVVTHPTGSEDVNTTFGVTQGPGQTFYAGFDLVNTGGAANVYFAHWRPSINFEFRSRVFITAHAGGDFTLAIGNESNTTQFVVSPDPMFFGINYRVVNSYDFNTGDSDLYVNGLLVAHFAGLTGGGPGMDHDQEPMDTYAFRQSNGDSTQTIDNLILADTLLEANGGPLPELGSCCDTVNNTCIDNITQPSCLAPGVWTLNGTCALNCDLTGSCCDETFMLPCTDNVLEVNCAPPLVWTEQGTCAANCVPGACCDAVGTCTPNLTKGNCQAVGGIFLGPNTDCTGGCPDFSQVMINEIRSGQPDADTDEYFELVGPSGFPLGGLTYLVIGDGTGGSGVIEEAIDLSGQAIPADGHFLAADSTTFTLAPIVDIDLDTALNFEDSDNVTHLLVAGFSGAIGDDLDGNDDCVLDSTPWVSESDRVALVEEANPPLATECHYGTTPDNTIQDIATGFAPGHVLRLPDAGLPWLIGDFNPFFGDDTPGVANALGTGACCSSDPMGGPNDLICTITDRATCETVLLGVYKGRDVTCLEVGDCRGACCVIDVGGSACTPNVFPADCTNDPAVGGLGGIYVGDATVCVPEPCTALCTDIFTGRADSEAAGVTVDVSVRLCDVTNPVVVSSATNVNNPGFPQFQLMDASGPDGSTAVTVFGGQALINAILTQIGGGNPANALGTIVQMQGAIGDFNGLAELQDGSFGGNLLPLEVLNSGTPGGGMALIPPPVPVTFLDFQGTAGEAVESENISLECFAFVDEPFEVPPVIIDGVTTFMGGGAQGNYTITDGTNTAVFRVGNLDIGIAGTVIPTGMVSATGLMGQFNSYQILPRSLGEINAAPTNCGPTGACTFAGQPGLCRQLTAEICAFVGGTFDPNSTCTVACTTCAGDMNSDNFVNDLDVPDFVTTLLAGGPSLCADTDGNGSIDGGDIQTFVERAIANTDCLAGPPATNLLACTSGVDCVGDVDGWCIYTVTNVNVFGPPCNSLAVGVAVQIPCVAGMCDPLGSPPETFNWVDGNAPGQDCFFEAQRAIFAGCDAAGLGAQTFNFAP